MPRVLGRRALSVLALAALVLLVLPLAESYPSPSLSPSAERTATRVGPPVRLTIAPQQVTTQQHSQARVTVQSRASYTSTQVQSLSTARIRIDITGGGTTRRFYLRLANRTGVLSVPRLPVGAYQVRAVFLATTKLNGSSSTYQPLKVVAAAPTPTPTPSGFPGAGNTGVPAGTVLHPCSGTITTSGTYDACEFPGSVQVKVSGVTITHSLIHGQVTGVGDTMFGAVLRDTEIDCRCPSTSDTDTPVAIQYDNFTLTRVDIHGAGHGVAMGSHVTIQDSWIHGLGGNTYAHKDGVYVGDANNSVIRHNRITCNDGSKAGCTAAIGLLTDFGPVRYVTIDRNLLSTNGSYCFYGEGGSSKPYSSDHVTFTNNTFSRAVSPKCGFYGPVTYFDSSAPGNVWAGNVWDNGTPVSASY